MKKPPEKPRLVLTVFFSVIVFIILVITMAVVAVLIISLTKLGVFPHEKSPANMVFSFLMITIPSSICVGTVVAVYMGRFPLRAVQKTVTAMNRLASGDFSARINFVGAKTGGILKEVSDSFNTLAEELENTEMLRSDFVNNFSHEFKTPIVSIHGFAKILRKGSLRDGQREEYLQIIEEESARLSSMATNVLNLTRIENQSILANVTQYNLSEQIRNCVLMFEKRWSEKNIDIKIDFNEFSLTADEELLKQVWINLLDNAVKFTPENGEIEIKIADNDEYISVSINNTGSEIPPQEQKKIFGKFYQADSSHSTQGNGVGLAIVKKIVQLHKGGIEVESKNNTTCFTVKLDKMTQKNISLL